MSEEQKVEIDFGSMKLNGNRLLLEILQINARGNIVLPQAVGRRYERGRVVARGPGSPIGETGQREIFCEVGDLVIFNPNAVTPVQFKGRNFAIIHDTDVHMTVPADLWDDGELTPYHEQMSQM